MPLPADVPAAQVCAALERIGFTAVRRARGHVVLRHAGADVRIVMPAQGPLKGDALRQILYQADLDAGELLALL